MVITRYQRTGPKAKIAVVADLHDRKSDHLLPVLKEENPDFILIPGDLTSKKIGHPKNRYTKETLKALSALCPVFYSRGNHEWMWEKEDIDEVRKMGIRFLENEYEHYGRFVIGGVKTLQKFGYMLQGNPEPDLSWLAEFEKEKGYHILLFHQPEYASKVSDKTELVVSGHAHGGQMILSGHGIFAPGQGFFPKYFKGEYGNMIVSAGLTNTTPLIPRFGNPAELVMIELSEGEKQNEC